MSIQFDYTIIHSLDRAYPIPTLSEGPLVLNDEIETYLTKHIAHVLGDTTTRKTFLSEQSKIYALLFDSAEENYEAITHSLAEWFYEALEQDLRIPSGDLIITFLTIDNCKKLAVLKCNYKEGFVHDVAHDEKGFIHTFKKETTLFPSGDKKLQEAVLIDLEEKSVWLVDESKEKYISDILGCSHVLSVKEKLQVVEQVVKETIETHYDNPVEAYAIAKSHMTENIYQTSTIPVKKLMEETFGTDEEVLEDCLGKIEEFGLGEEVIEATQKSLSKKYTSHKMKTNTGIELKMPTELMQNKEFVEIIEEADGSLSILLKKIGEITHK